MIDAGEDLVFQNNGRVTKKVAKSDLYSLIIRVLLPCGVGATVTALGASLNYG